MATKTRVLQLNNYPSGVYSFVQQTPQGLGNFRTDIGRCTTLEPTIWPNATTIVDLFFTPSYDGGVTFDPVAKAGFSGATGGIHVNNKNGQEFTVETVGGNFFPVANAVKIDVTVTGGPIRTYVDVTV